ncbi:MAG: hypothetical protein ACOX6V_02595 [Patescibacteria group bacterium]|jgi:hypothetical protein
MSKNGAPPKSYPWFRYGIILLLFLFIVSGGYFSWKKNQLTLIPKKNNDQIVTAPIAYFKIDTFPVLSKVLVKTSFKPPAQPTEMWLSVDTIQGAELVMVLISHPFLDNLEWAAKENQEYTLFQKVPTFQSVEAFLSNPPADATIIADPLIAGKELIAKGNVIPLETETDFEQADYILTTYHKHYEDDGYTVADAIVDASNAAIEEGKLTWALHMSGVSPENPIVLKGVDVEYLYPPQGSN